MYHIMIIEDDEIIRQELTSLLRNALFQVSEIKEFIDVTRKIKEANPDLVLLDVNLPGVSGMDICKELRKDSDIPVIFITGNNTTMDELNCLQQGGDDFISKPFQPPILLARIQTLLKRTVKNPNKTSRLSYRDIILDLATATIRAGNNQIDLTKNELKIMHFLFIHAGNYVTRSDLTNFLWDNEVFIDDNTLSVNMTRIRKKLSEIGIEDFIETGRGLGYKLC